MKKLMTTTLIVMLLCCSHSYGQYVGDQHQYVEYLVSLNHPDRTYKAGQEAIITVQAQKGGIPLDGVEIRYSVGGEMVLPPPNQTTQFRQGVATISMGTTSESGFRECDLEFEVFGKTYKDVVKVGYDIDQIHPYTVMPKDFQKFWQQEVKKARQISLDAHLTRMPQYSDAQVDVFLIRLTVGENGKCFYGYLSKPHDDQKHPVMFCPPGAGPYKRTPQTDFARKGFIVLNVDIHGHNPELSKDYFDGVWDQTFAYWNRGLQSRDSCYYRQVYAGCVRCVDFLCSLSEWDGKNVVCKDGSQGGALSIVTAALHEKATLVCAAYPALCDLTGFAHGRAGGWPKYFFKDSPERKPTDKVLTTNDKAEIETLQYFDVVNFARILKAPGYYYFGFNDNFCSPTSIFAMLNEIKAPHTVVNTFTNGHFNYPESEEKAKEWVMSMVGAHAASELLNREWRYSIGDHIGAESPDYDDEAWDVVGLPHSYSIPYFLSKDFYTGYGWYRRHLTMNREDCEDLAWLVFEGVFQEAEVFVNGQLAGQHRGGYTAFCIDITPFVREGDNVLAVRVNNLWQPTVAPRGGEHVFSGGIYRNVRLMHKSAMANIRWQGVRVSTPTLEQNQGQASVVKVDVDTDIRQAKNAHVEVDILNEDGQIVGHNGDEIRNPKLWNPDTPYLYRAVVRLYDGRQLLDEETVNFGFRWFRWSKDEGFFLNGKRLVLRGANVHQDQAGWGDAVTDEAARRDVRMMKEAGFNWIRGSHYPHSQAFVDECDRQGMLFWSEAPFWGTAGPKDDGWWTASAYPVVAADTAAFKQNVLCQLKEMIEQHRNHPSVFVWSMCNELFFTDGSTMPGVRQLLREMVTLSHQEDPSRPAAIGGAQRPLGGERIDLIGDVAGYNGDGANIAEFQHPAVPSVVSEYGSTTAERPGRYFAGWGDLARDDGWQGREWRGGQAIWCGFDHGSIFGEEMAKMGIVDYFRLPKRSWYWYRNEYRQAPPPQWPTEGVPTAVRLSASKTDEIKTDGTDDVHLTAAIVDSKGQELSNSPAVTLRILSGPGEFPTGRSITFVADSDIRIQDGKCAITLRSYYAGETLVEARSIGLRADTIRLRFTDGPTFTKGVSPQTEERPYTRYVRPNLAQYTYGVNSPTFANSSMEGHSPGLAADGDSHTFWQPTMADESPYWTLDAERTLMVSAIHWVQRSPVCITAETSPDNEHWTEVGQGEGVEEEITLEPRRKARFVRLSFPKGSRPSLSEVSITGFIQQRTNVYEKTWNYLCCPVGSNAGRKCPKADGGPCRGQSHQ